MTTVPGWGVVSSVAAPVVLIGGWTLAAGLQPDGFSSVRDTISALAAHDAHQPVVMTSALLALGACHVVSAAALRPAATAGRVVLAVGGVATLGVAAFPLPGGDAGSTAHTVAAATVFAALAVWPALSWRRGAAARALRPAAALGAAAVLTAAVGWFAVELVAGSDRVGLSERVAAASQAVWPMVVVLSARRPSAAS